MSTRDREPTAASERAGERLLGEIRVPGTTVPPGEPTDLVPTWPNLLFRELLALLICVIVLSVISIVVDAPLEDPADPSRTPNPAKAPWYFVGLQELLTYFDSWIAGVGIPVLIVLGLCLIPYLDPTRNDVGVYTVRRRPVASTIFIVGLVGWFLLIAVGLWFRGPGWTWVWPGTTPAAVEAETLRSFPNFVGVPLVLAFFVGGGFLIVRMTAAWTGFTLWRRWVFAILLLAMIGTLIKIALRIGFDVQYIVRFEGLGLNL